MGIPVGLGCLLTCWLVNSLNFLFLARGLFVFLVAAWFVRFLLRRYRWRLRAARAIDHLAATVAAMGWRALLLYLVMLAPWRGPAALALAAAIFFLDRRRKDKRSLAFTAPLALFALGLWVWAPVLLLLPALAGGLWRLTARRPDLTPGGARWALWLAALAIVAIVFPFHLGQPWGEKARVTAQPDVSLVYDAHDRQNPLFATIGRDVRCGQPDCYGRLLIGARGGPNGLIRLANEQVSTAQTGPLGETIAVNCRNKQLYVGDWSNGSLRILDHESLHLAATVAYTRLTRVDQVQFQPEHQFVFMSAANSRNIFMYDLYFRKKEMIFIDRFITDFASLPHEQLFIISTYGGRLLFYRHDLSQLLYRQWLPDFHLQLAASPSSDTLYILGRYSGMLWEYSLAKRRLVRSRWLGPGIRDIAFDERDELLYVGNYFTGVITTLRRADLGTAAVHRVGPRLHSLHYDHFQRRLLAADALGLVQIQLAK